MTKTIQEPPIFYEILEMCKRIFPGYQWEIQEREMSKSFYVYKLIGQGHEIRTSERIDPTTDRQGLLAKAEAAAHTIAQRINRIAKAQKR